MRSNRILAGMACLLMASLIAPTGHVFAQSKGAPDMSHLVQDPATKTGSGSGSGSADSTPRPDLVVDSFKFDPATIYTITPVNMVVVVKNIGKVEAKASKVMIKAGGEAPDLVKYYDVPALKPGATFTAKRTETFGNNFKYLCDAAVDTGKVVEESNESNNGAQITFEALPAYDLMITSFKAVRPDPKSKKTTWTVTVKNPEGSRLKTPATKVAIQVGGEPEKKAKKYDLPALEPGKSATVERKEDLDSKMNFGGTVVVDPENKVAETDEKNNKADAYLKAN